MTRTALQTRRWVKYRIGVPLAILTTGAGCFSMDRALLTPYNVSMEKRKLANREWRDQRLLETDRQLALCAKQKPAVLCVDLAQSERKSIDLEYDYDEGQMEPERKSFVAKALCWVGGLVILTQAELLGIPALAGFMVRRKEEKEASASEKPRHLKAVP